MKKLMAFGIIGVWIVLLSTACVRSQGSKEDLSKRKIQADRIAVNDRYVIGPEDVLFIHVWKEETLSRTVPVRMDGKISLPLIDDVQAAGYTPLQLKEILTQRLKGFIDAPVVSVVVSDANSFKIYVYGEVKSPGVHRLRSETSLLQFIIMVGGFTEWANQKKILIIRKENGKENRMIVNYKKIVKGDAPDSNIILKSGDTIIVP